jgi:hypothetical protein
VRSWASGGTTYLRAQLLDEPERTDSLQLLRQYADQAVDARAAVDEPAASAR